MPLSDDIRGLTDQVLDRVDEAREFYVHSRQAWRLVQQLVRKGRPVGIVDPATRRHLPTGDLESCSLVGCVKFAQTHHFMNAGASSSTRRTGYRSCPQGLDLATRDIDIDIVHVHGSALEGRALEQFGKGTRNAELWASFSSRYHKDCPRSQAVIFTGRSTSPEAGAS